MFIKFIFIRNSSHHSHRAFQYNMVKSIAAVQTAQKAGANNWPKYIQYILA